MIIFFNLDILVVVKLSLDHEFTEPSLVLLSFFLPFQAPTERQNSQLFQGYQWLENPRWQYQKFILAQRTDKWQHKTFLREKTSQSIAKSDIHQHSVNFTSAACFWECTTTVRIANQCKPKCWSDHPFEYWQQLKYFGSITFSCNVYM